jgi:hypothetical protein
LFEKNVKLEKHWHHVFTSTIALTGADMWYKKLRETIERQQQQNIWIADNKPDEIISDDFLFPMTSRMSYASTAESDLDVTLDSCKDDDDDEDRKDSKELSGSRLVKSCSDPSIAKLDIDDEGPSTPGASSSHHHRSHHRHQVSCSRLAHIMYCAALKMSCPHIFSSQFVLMIMHFPSLFAFFLGHYLLLTCILCLNLLFDD